MRRSTAALSIGAAALLGSWLFGSLALAPVGIGILAAAVGARAWRRYAAARLLLERRVVATRLVEGETLEIELRLTGRLLGWARAVARETVGDLGTVEVPLHRGLGRLAWPGVPRGRHLLGPAHVSIEDPFGLERAEVAAQETAAVLVRPRFVDVGTLFADQGREGFDGRRPLPRRGVGVDLHSVRDYQEGEPLRLVHWPTTARRGALTVMELQDAPHDESVVVLDCDTAGAVGPPGHSSFDDATRVAASLVRARVARGRTVALVAGGGAAGMLRVNALDGSWDAALDLLAAVKPDARRSLQAVLADPRLAPGRAPELIIVTSRPEAIGAAVLDTRRAGGVVLVDAPTYAGAGPSPPAPALLRLAGAGVPVAVVRCGDDLATALGGISIDARSA